MRNILEAFLNKQLHASSGTEGKSLEPQRVVTVAKD